jgi:hypothetical protein
MEQEKYAKLFNPNFNIGLVSWREAWLFNTEFPEKLITEVHKGKLVFRKKGSANRISYRQLKNGLIKKTILIKQPPPSLPF